MYNLPNYRSTTKIIPICASSATSDRQFRYSNNPIICSTATQSIHTAAITNTAVVVVVVVVVAVAVVVAEIGWHLPALSVPMLLSAPIRAPCTSTPDRSCACGLSLRRGLRAYEVNRTKLRKWRNREGRGVLGRLSVGQEGK